jgi:hypothetical protein
LIVNKIEKEVIFFAELLKDINLIKTFSDDKQFWKKYKSNMPTIYKFCLIVLNIPSSGSFIERFFNISGIICDKRSGNISNGLVCARSLLKANYKLIIKLSAELLDDEIDESI